MNKQAYFKMMRKSSGLWGDFTQALGDQITAGKQKVKSTISNFLDQQDAINTRKQKQENQRNTIGEGVRAAQFKQKVDEAAKAAQQHAKKIKDMSMTAAEKAQERLRNIQFRNLSNKILDTAFPIRKLSPIQQLQTILPGIKQDNAKSVAEGVPSFSLLGRIAKNRDKLDNQVGPLSDFGRLLGSGILQPGQREALEKNRSIQQNFKNSGFWHRLMETLKQYWAKISKGTDQHTERFKAMLAGDRVKNILSAVRGPGK